MEPYIFFIISMAILATVLIIDRKRIKKHLWVISIGLILAFIFETGTTYLGFWIYHASPKIIIISLYSWLEYMPYLSLCYFAGGFFGEKDE